MATLTITNPSVKTGENLYFSWSGFGAGDTILIEVWNASWVKLGYFNVYGASGSSGFNVGDPPGTYYLTASNSGFAYAQYTVTAATTSGWLPAFYSLVNSATLQKSIVQAPGWVPAFYSLVNSGTLTKTIPQVSGWWPAFYSIVNSGALTYTIPQAPGWMPAFTVLVNSGQLVATVPQVEGWMPVLYSLARSGELVSTVPQVEGWASALYSLVNSGELESTIPQTAGWTAALTALVNSVEVVAEEPLVEGWRPALTEWITAPALVLPSGGEEPSGTSPWVWALVAGVGIMAAASMGKGKPPVTPKQLTTTGKMS